MPKNRGPTPGPPVCSHDSDAYQYPRSPSKHIKPGPGGGGNASGERARRPRCKPPAMFQKRLVVAVCRRHSSPLRSSNGGQYPASHEKMDGRRTSAIGQEIAARRPGTGLCAELKFLKKKAKIRKNKKMGLRSTHHHTCNDDEDEDEDDDEEEDDDDEDDAAPAANCAATRAAILSTGIGSRITQCQRDARQPSSSSAFLTCLKSKAGTCLSYTEHNGRASIDANAEYQLLGFVKMKC